MARRVSFDELVDNEAKALATAMLERRLTALDLPLPKDGALEVHVSQLLTTNPTIRETAKARVLASQDAHSESLRAIGLPVPDLVIPIDIGDLEDVEEKT